MTSLGIRRRLLFAVTGIVAAALVATIAAFNVLLTRQLSADASRLAHSRAAAALALLRPAGGRLVVREAPDAAAPDAQVWVFSRGKTLEAPSAGELVGRAAQELAGRAPGSTDVSAADTRLYAAPVVVGGSRLGTVVAAVSLAPYEQTRRTALVASLALGVVLLLAAALGARWLLASALLPVARMTRQASEWSERELDERFALGEPHDELTELAATLDALLDRLAAGLRRERRFSAELSHELRTPLARIIAESELALLRERPPGQYRDALELVHGNARRLAQTVDALVAAARHAGVTAGRPAAPQTHSRLRARRSTRAPRSLPSVGCGSRRSLLRGRSGSGSRRISRSGSSSRSWRTRAVTAGRRCSSRSRGPTAPSRTRSQTTAPG